MPTNINGNTGIDKVQDGTVVNADIDTLDASKLTGSIAAARIANNTIDSAHIASGAVDDAHLATGITASKLTGALPAISAANLTAIPAANITGTLPAISAANLTNVPKDVTVGGRKNLIINGAMTVNQRGSVNTTDGGGEYALDRWETYLRGGAAATVSQATDVPSGQGFGNSLKIDVTTGDAFGTSNDLALLRTKWEGQDLQQLAYGTSSAKTLTLSFWIKSTITGTYMCSLNNNDDNDRMNNRSYTISSANTWEKKTLTFNGDTSAGTINNDNTGSIELRFWLASGSNYNTGTLSSDGNWEAYNVANQAVGHVNSLNSASNNIYLTGVQLELGSVATDFEHRSYGEELALCQRYFYLCANGSSQEIGSAWYYTNSMIASIIELPVPMRASPSVVQASQGDQYGLYRSGAANTFSTVTIDNGSFNNLRVSVYNNNEASGTAGQTGDFKMINANGSLAFNAEL